MSNTLPFDRLEIVTKAVPGDDVPDTPGNIPPPATARSRLNWQKRTKWFAAEFLVVLTGVLVALALNAAWDARQDRLREAEYLTQLRADLLVNRARIEEAIRLEETTRAGASAVLRSLGHSAVLADSAKHWMIDQRASFYSDPRLLMGTFAALMQTGDIKLLRDATVRRRTIEYQSQVEADQVEIGRWVERLTEHLTRFYGAAAAEDAWLDWDPQTTPHQVRALLAAHATAPARDAFFGMYWTSSVRLVYLNRMLAATAELIEVLPE